MKKVFWVSAVVVAAAAALVCVLFLSAIDKPLQPTGKFQKERILVQQGDLYGCMDTLGNLAIPCIYSSSESLKLPDTDLDLTMPTFVETEKLIPLIDKSLHTIGYINCYGEEVIPPIYDESAHYYDLNAFYGGFAAMEQDSKFGFFNEKGEAITPIIYDKVRPFSDGMAAVYIQDRGWGFIDTTGAEIIPLQYDSVQSFSDGLASVTDFEGNKFYIDKSGNTVISIDNTVIATPFSEGLAFVQLFPESEPEKRKRMYIDKSGNEVFEVTFDFLPKDVFVFEQDPLCTMSEGMAEAWCHENGEDKLGFMDNTGKLAIAAEYDKTSPFQEGLAAVFIEGKGYGYIDKNGSEVIPLDPDRVAASSFSEGVALEDNYYEGQRYITPEGEIAFPTDRFTPGLFKDGVALIEMRVDGEADSQAVHMQGYISNPVQSSANPNAVPLLEGVFANPSKNGYDRLENSQGEVLVEFDDQLSKCNKYYSSAIKAETNADFAGAKKNYLNALDAQPNNVYILKALMELCEEQNDMDAYNEYNEQYLSIIKAYKEKCLRYGVEMP